LSHVLVIGCLDHKPGFLHGYSIVAAQESPR
jgi:hypothetical protein